MPSAQRLLNKINNNIKEKKWDENKKQYEKNLFLILNFLILFFYIYHFKIIIKINIKIK